MTFLKAAASKSGQNKRFTRNEGPLFFENCHFWCSPQYVCLQDLSNLSWSLGVGVPHWGLRVLQEAGERRLRRLRARYSTERLGLG